jgi:hypothetical protein
MTTPRHDIPPPRERFAAGRERSRQGLLARLASRFLHPRGRGKRRSDEGGQGVPVDPNRPNTLTGGAAAPLDFEE